MRLRPRGGRLQVAPYRVDNISVCPLPITSSDDHVVIPSDDGDIAGPEPAGKHETAAYSRNTVTCFNNLHLKSDLPNETAFFNLVWNTRAGSYEVQNNPEPEIPVARSIGLQNNISGV
ncbi:MAG TPA: hypothetical protein PL033_01585 [Candidatus Brocadiia bacterium]|nr:hypothetical protein [Candidatus Brocadiia bacterium]